MSAPELAKANALLREARNVLADMVRYSGMNEPWQDNNPQYVRCAEDTADRIDAHLEQTHAKN